MSELKSLIGETTEDDNVGSDPIEVLLNLAKQGEIDPWDVDITEVTEKFLRHIESLQSRDIRIPARVLLYASIFLRMKSDSLEEKEDEELDDDYFEDELPVQDYKVNRSLKLPIRRSSRRPVTLHELISELKRAEKVAIRKKIKHTGKPKREETVTTAINRAHEENIEDRIKKLGIIIAQRLENQDRVSFREIGGNDVLNYVSVLFMAHRRLIWLEQDSLFGELYLKRYHNPGDY